MDLFTQLENSNKQTPLAEILRPTDLEDFLGQSNVVAPNSPLLNLIKSQRLFSLIFWGTPGCGKTTLARLIAQKVQAQFIELSAVSSGIKDIDKSRVYVHNSEGVNRLLLDSLSVANGESGYYYNIADKTAVFPFFGP